MHSEALSFEVLGSKQTLISKAQAAKDAAKALSKNNTKTYSPLYVLDSGAPTAGQLTVGDAFLQINSSSARPVSASNATAHHTVGSDCNTRSTLQQGMAVNDLLNRHRQGGRTSRPSSAPSHRSLVGAPVVIKVGFDAQNLGPNGLAWQAQPIAATANAYSNSRDPDLALEPITSAMSPLHRAVLQRDPAPELRRSGSWLTSGARPTSAGSLSVRRSISLNSSLKSAWATDASDQQRQTPAYDTATAVSVDCTTDVASSRADQLLNRLFRNLNPSKPDCNQALISSGKVGMDANTKITTGCQSQIQQTSGSLARSNSNPLTPRTAAIQMQAAKQPCSTQGIRGISSAVTAASEPGLDQQRLSNAAINASISHTGSGRPGTPMTKQTATNTTAVGKTDTAHNPSTCGTQQLVTDCKTPGKQGFDSPPRGGQKLQRHDSTRRSKTKSASSPESPDVGSRICKQEQQTDSTVQNFTPSMQKRQCSKGGKPTSLLSSQLRANPRENNCKSARCEQLQYAQQAPYPVTSFRMEATSSVSIIGTTDRLDIAPPEASPPRNADVPQQDTQGMVTIMPQASLQSSNLSSVHIQQQASQANTENGCVVQSTPGTACHDNPMTDIRLQPGKEDTQQSQPASAHPHPKTLSSTQHDDASVHVLEPLECVITSNQDDVSYSPVSATITTSRRPHNLTLDMTGISDRFGVSSAMLLGPVYRHVIKAGPTENVNISPVKLICSASRARPATVGTVYDTSNHQQPAVQQSPQEGVGSYYQIPADSVKDLIQFIPGGGSLPHSSTQVMDDLMMDAISLLIQFGLSISQILEQ